MASTDHPTIPDEFPDEDKEALVRTAGGHLHRLRPGWHTIGVKRTDHGVERYEPDAVRGITLAGYFVSVRWTHVESIEQAGPDVVAPRPAPVPRFV